MLQEKIFKSYDIRGIYPDEINEESAKEIAELFLSFVSDKTSKKPQCIKIVITRDVRNSSEALANAFIETLVSKGVKVYDLGLMSVDVIYFAVGKFDYDGGVTVTASHNPGSYGGFKMVSRGVEWIRGKELWDYRNKKKDFENANGECINIDIWKEYLDFIFSFIDISKIKPMKIVVDAGNGMAGIMIPEIIKRLPQIELVPLFFESDGNFPNRNPNPLAEDAPEKLSKKVVDEKADVGFIFDADSDRVFLVDDEGKFLQGDDVILVLAKQLLEKNPGAGIVYNLVCSKNVKEFIEKNGGCAIRSEVGYVNMGTHMKNENGVMGGEFSGHFSYAENYYADSGYISFLIILQAISEKDFKLSDFMDSNKRWHRYPEIVASADNMIKMLDNIRNYYSKNILDEIDGITVEFSDWWFNVRASNTEPVVKTTIEVVNGADINIKREEVMNVLNS